MRGNRNLIKIGFITERMLLGYGVDLEIHKIAEGLAARGYQIKVFSNLVDDTYQGSKYKIRSIPTQRTPLFPLYEWRALKWLNHLNSQDIDVYIIETFPYYSLLPFLKGKKIAVDHGICPTIGFPLRLKMNFAYMAQTQYRLYFPYAHKIITISESIKTTLPPRLQRKTEVIYEGIDHYSLPGDWGEARQVVRKKYGIKDDDILLLYVGRLNHQGQPYKGVKDLLEIYQEARKADGRIRLMAVGLGSRGDEEVLRQHGVIPCVNAPVSEMSLIYLGCDVYVTASKWEGFDLPLLEAHYFGRPGVAFRVGAHPEVTLDGRSALLVSSKHDFLQGVLCLAQDEQKRLKMGREASQHVAKYSWQRTADAYDSLIREAIS